MHTHETTTLDQFSYSFDAADRITSVSSTDGTTAYSNDNTNQLTAADHSYQTDESYSYDANGNRTNPGYQTGPNNRLLADGTFTYWTDGDYVYRRIRDGSVYRTPRVHINTFAGEVDGWTTDAWDHWFLTMGWDACQSGAPLRALSAADRAGGPPRLRRRRLPGAKTPRASDPDQPGAQLFHPGKQKLRPELAVPAPDRLRAGPGSYEPSRSRGIACRYTLSNAPSFA